MSLRGVSDGTWSVFAEKVVQERDEARDEVARLEKQLVAARADSEQLLVLLKAYYHECQCRHEAVDAVNMRAYAAIRKADAARDA